jgi:lysophospholipase L1-like esterase
VLIKKIAALFLVIISVFLLIYSAEKILSIKNKKDLGYSESNKSQGDRYILLREHKPLTLMAVEPPPEYVAKYTDSLARQKHIFRTDENGFIIPSKIYDNPDVSIVFLGGSTTECMYMDEKNRFPYLAGRMLEEETGKKINSYNGGVSGNNSLHSIDILLNKVVPIKPDIVIMTHNINDLMILLLCNTYWNSHPGKAPVTTVNATWQDLLKQAVKRFVPNLFSRIRAVKNRVLLESQMDEFKNIRGTKISIDKNRMQDEFRMNLQTFINICSARNITPVLMTQQNRFKERAQGIIYNAAKTFKSDYGIEYNDYKETYDLFNETIRDVGKENNVLVIDLAKEIPQEQEYIYDSVHLNDTGSRLAAQIITRELKKIINK